MEIFKSFATSYDNAREPITKMVIEQIALDMSAKLRLTQTKRQELDKILEEIRKKVLNTDRPPETIISGFVIDKMWQSLLPNFEFNGSVWASQRLCYGAVYYAYEDFLVRTYRLAIGKPDYRMKFAKEFARDLAKAFSVELSDFCFSGEVDVARRARNALAHSGGRITEELREIGHAFPVVNGEIQITTAHTRALFDLLKERVAKLVPEALKRLPGQHTKALGCSAGSS